MNLLNKLTIKNLKLNKKRTIVTIIGIILSTALITAVASMFFSVQESLLRFEIKERGNYHYAFYDVKTTDLNDFKLNKKVEEISVVKNLGYAKLDTIKNSSKPYVYVTAFSKDAIDNLSITVVKGHLPKNENEIAIPEHLRTNGQVKLNVGDTLTLDVGTRTIEGEHATQFTQFTEDIKEKIEDKTKKTYKVVGIIKRPSLYVEPYSAPGYTALTYLNENDLTGTVDVYTRYTKNGLLSHCKTTAGIIGIEAAKFENVCKNYTSVTNAEYKDSLKEMENAKYGYSMNSRVLTLESGSTNDSFLIILMNAASVVIVIIIVTSVFCIHNSFAISITEKTKQYGMLASIGATKKQIKKNVYYEALILGIIGIPVGLLIGNLAAYILVLITNILLKEAMAISLVFKLSWLAIVFAIILSLITLLLSARKSAQRASKITPITAIRNSEDIKIKKQKIKTSKLIRKIFGVGGEIAHKNLQRSKKKYRATVISIAVCVTVFISLSAFINFAYDLIKVNYASINYNIDAWYDVQANEDIAKNIERMYELPNIKNISLMSTGPMNVNAAKYSEAYLNLNKKYNNGYYKDLISKKKNKGTLNYVILDDESFERYTKQINYNDKDSKKKAILINKMYDQFMLDNSNQAKSFEVEKYAYKVGDTISIQTTNYDFDINEDIIVGELDIEIGKLTTKVPVGLMESNYDAILIMHEDTAKKLLPQKYTKHIFIDSKNPDETYKFLKEIFEDNNVYIENISSNVKVMNSLIILVSIFLYGFITVIALIGITNIFNTITTNMDLRRREFAMLKSIGMTKKEFNRMIRLESIFYGTKALIFSIPLGTIIAYLIYVILSDGDIIMKFTPPYNAIIISTLVVFLLLFIIMKYSINKINSQNTIETIRNENI